MKIRPLVPLLVIGVLFAAPACSSSKKTPQAGATPTATAASPMNLGPSGPAGGSMPPTVPPHDGKKRTTFGDGMWAVGSDIKPGTYTATVPKSLQGCYWVRAKDTSGQLDSILQDQTAEGGKKITVTIKPTDKVFATDGCGTWTAS